jgi:hypothetical protein
MATEVKCAGCGKRLGFIPAPGTTFVRSGRDLPRDGLCEVCRYHRRAAAERRLLDGGRTVLIKR